MGSILSLLTLIFFAKLFIYITFLSRLYLTFIESVHKISRKLLYFMIFLLILFILNGIYFNVLLFLKCYLNIFSFYLIQIQMIAIFAFLAFIDMMISIILIYQFIKKLFLLITERRRTIIERSKLASFALSKSVSSEMKQMSFSQSLKLNKKMETQIMIKDVNNLSLGAID